MDDSGVRRHHTKIAECGLSPAEQDIAFPVALKLQKRICLKRALRAILVDLHGVIDHQIGRQQWIGAIGVGTLFRKRIAHSRQIDHRRNTGKILQQDARRHKADFFRFRPEDAARHVPDVVGGNTPAIFMPQ